jgi:hypothetical protein
MSDQRPGNLPDTVTGTNPLSCSFCKKTTDVVGPLAEGPNHVYICYPCVRLCADIIENQCRRIGVEPILQHA